MPFIIILFSDPREFFYPQSNLTGLGLQGFRYLHSEQEGRIGLTKLIVCMLYTREHKGARAAIALNVGAKEIKNKGTAD
ncbi:hypothetical protein ACJX0J_035277, partial [Zea mays]